jgi:hypothetical protein
MGIELLIFYQSLLIYPIARCAALNAATESK